MDLLAGNYWFKYKGNGEFASVRFANSGGRLAVGKFKPGKTLQIVVSPGDGVGYLTWYECIGDPTDTASWQGHRLIDTQLIHCHSLSVDDINGDGNLDIFAAEMAKWTEKNKQPDNPNAQAFIFYGDGKGHFKKTVFSTGIGYHEAKVADLDGDGDLDILDKPYNWEAPRVDVWLQRGTGKLLPSLSKTFKGKIGLELYSLHSNLQKDFDGTLNVIHKMGITEVEVPQLYGRSAKEMKNALHKAHLKPSSLLCSYEQLRDSLPEIIQNAKALNVQYVVCTWIPHGDQFTQEDVDNAAILFNKIGVELKAQQMHFIYHTHGYEFIPTSTGETLMDVLAREMKPGIADFEMDIFWVWKAGQDAALFLKKYPGSFVALHLKDMKEGTPTGQYSGSAPNTTSVALGKGVIDYLLYCGQPCKLGSRNSI